MTEELRRHAVLLAALAAVLIAGAWQLLGSAAPGGRSGAGPEIALAGPGTGSQSHGRRRTAAPALVVHVAGAVRRPGVYRVPEGARVGVAVRRAGGATAAADLTAVNLAARASDGQQVIVPERALGGAGARPSSGAAPRPVSLSTATVEQLDALEGIGPKLAEAIVAYRARHGGFRSIDELDQVDGIGESRLAALRETVRP